jgi:ubiquinone/menaquinone biosynthesis C-methylase UbiE
MAAKELEHQTRQVFDRIHRQHLETPQSVERFRSLISTQNLRVPSDFFHDKLCVDVGAGSSGCGTVNLLQLGARHVVALELDCSFAESLRPVLDAEPEYAGRWSLRTGSVLDLPFADNSFDFVLCQGVLHHTADEQRGLSEICRVTRAGGNALITVGGGGGIATRLFKGLLRDEYQSNPFFHEFIDNRLSVEWMQTQIGFLRDNLEDDGSPRHHDALQLLDALERLVDRDFILSVLDRIQAPKYATYTTQQLEEMFATAGFSSWYRVSRRPKYDNIRRIFSILYEKHDHDLARLLYGEGGLNYVLQARA